MNTYTHHIISMAAVCLLTACSQSADDGNSSSAALESSNEGQAISASVLERPEARALLRDRDYVAARAITQDRQLELDQRLASHLKLDERETSVFLAIMSEHRAARLVMQDVMTASSGLSREQRNQQLQNTGANAEAASPAYVQRRIASELGAARLAAYREAMHKNEGWRFSAARGDIRSAAPNVASVNETAPTVAPGSVQKVEVVK